MKNMIMTCLALALAIPAFASTTVQVGPRTYNVSVQNAYGREIWGAFVNVSESGSFSLVTARAQGYRDGSASISVWAGQNSVWVNVRLEDPQVFVNVIDRENHFVNAWVDQSQILADANEYRLDVRLPAAGFTKFQRQDVRTDAFATWVNVSGPATARHVELHIPRNAIPGWTASWRIQIPSDNELTREANFAKLHAGN